MILPLFFFFYKGKNKINLFRTAHGKGMEKRGDPVGALPARGELSVPCLGVLRAASAWMGLFWGAETPEKVFQEQGEAGSSPGTRTRGTRGGCSP